MNLSSTQLTMISSKLLSDLRTRLNSLGEKFGIDMSQIEKESKNDTPMIPEGNLPKELLGDMLQRENDLRLSPGIQKIYQDRNENPQKGDWIDYTYQLQEDVVKEFGFTHPMEISYALAQLRSATYIYPELASIPLYVKYNRAKRGKLRTGMRAPDIPLYDTALEPRQKWMLDYCHHQNNLSSDNNTIRKPLFVCAASWT